VTLKAVQARTRAVLAALVASEMLALAAAWAAVVITVAAWVAVLVAWAELATAQV
jgi:hypothetical protein